MLIGNRYSDSKMYKGIRHYDGLPLTSGDLHEYADLIHMKNAYLTDNIIGSGILNSPETLIDDSGIKLSEPAVALIEGDIALIQSSSSTPIISKNDIIDAGYEDGILCILGWYQLLTHQSTLKEYGGVNNAEIINDILDRDLNIQVSTRYQFRWDTVLIPKYQLEDPQLTFQYIVKNAAGIATSDEITINTNSKIGNIYTAPVPSSMDYALSDLYIIPLLSYSYNSGNINSAKSLKAVTPKGSTGFLSSSTEPTGDFNEGTIWYDPTTYKFKFYVPGVGFVDTAKEFSLLHYNNTVTMNSSITTPQDITVNIGINDFAQNDILQVIYEGITLTENTHYTVDYKNRTIKLLNFTVVAGELITFIVMKLVNNSNANTIASELTKHMASNSTSTISGHVKLSDTMDNSQGASSHIAATPKAVYDATLIKDTNAGLNYKFVVSDGILYLEEV